MTALVFELMSLDSGTLLGFGLVCTEARYCGVNLTEGARLDRRFVSPREWRAVEREAATVGSEPVSTDSAIGQAFRAHRGMVVQYLRSIPIDAPPEEVATVLDDHLRAQRRDAS